MLSIMPSTHGVSSRMRTNFSETSIAADNGPACSRFERFQALPAIAVEEYHFEVSNLFHLAFEGLDLRFRRCRFVHRYLIEEAIATKLHLRCRFNKGWCDVGRDIHAAYRPRIIRTGQLTREGLQDLCDMASAPPAYLILMCDDAGKC